MAIGRFLPWLVYRNKKHLLPDLPTRSFKPETSLASDNSSSVEGELLSWGGTALSLALVNLNFFCMGIFQYEYGETSLLEYVYRGGL